MQTAAKIMIERNIRGSIVNITSSRAERAYPEDAVYGGVKAAIRRASQSAALDLAPYGIRVNCANRWQQFLHVTLPGLKPTIITLTLMSIGRIFYSDFGLFYQVPMDSGALMDVTNTIDTFVYRSMMQLNNIGMASAAGVYQSLVGFVLVLTANFVVRKLDSENALF